MTSEYLSEEQSWELVEGLINKVREEGDEEKARKPVAGFSALLESEESEGGARDSATMIMAVTSVARLFAQQGFAPELTLSVVGTQVLHRLQADEEEAAGKKATH